MLSSRILGLVTLLTAAGSFMFCSGCCGNSQAANAQTPPPQSLAEPVRVTQAAPVTEEPRAVPVSVRDNDPLPSHTPLKVGESRDLPQFLPPTPPPAPKPAAAVVPSQSPADGQYHILAKGETLSSVSRKYNVRLKAVIDANHFKDPNHLSVGTKVFIPGN